MSTGAGPPVVHHPLLSLSTYKSPIGLNCPAIINTKFTSLYPKEIHIVSDDPDQTSLNGMSTITLPVLQVEVSLLLRIL